MVLDDLMTFEFISHTFLFLFRILSLQQQYIYVALAISEKNHPRSSGDEYIKCSMCIECFLKRYISIYSDSTNHFNYFKLKQSIEAIVTILECEDVLACERFQIFLINSRKKNSYIILKCENRSESCFHFINNLCYFLSHLRPDGSDRLTIQTDWKSQALKNFSDFVCEISNSISIFLKNR